MLRSAGALCPHRQIPVCTFHITGYTLFTVAGHLSVLQDLPPIPYVLQPPTQPLHSKQLQL